MKELGLLEGGKNVERRWIWDHSGDMVQAWSSVVPFKLDEVEEKEKRPRIS